MISTYYGSKKLFLIKLCLIHSRKKFQYLQFYIKAKNVIRWNNYQSIDFNTLGFEFGLPIIL